MHTLNSLQRVLARAPCHHATTGPGHSCSHPFQDLLPPNHTQSPGLVHRGESPWAHEGRISAKHDEAIMSYYPCRTAAGCTFRLPAHSRRCIPTLNTHKHIHNLCCHVIYIWPSA